MKNMRSLLLLFIRYFGRSQILLVWYMYYPRKTRLLFLVRWPITRRQAMKVHFYQFRMFGDQIKVAMRHFISEHTSDLGLAWA